MMARALARPATVSIGVALAVLFASAPALLAADPDPVAVRMLETRAFTGQKLSFNVDLYSAGSFGGATFFTIPEVPDTVILEVGETVVSSKEIDGRSWFVQSHEFALFSQASGIVRVPAFPVRFGTRDGFTGPTTQVETDVPGFEVEITRPPGTGSTGFLVTTNSFQVAEAWDPEPSGPVEVGAVFKRTITQKVAEMSGMALEPAPTAGPEGVRVYAGTPEVADNTERGAFDGRRVDVVTYLIEKPGSHVLPAIRYSWWNPDKGELETKTLPEVTITAKALPAPPSPWRSIGWGALALLLVLAGFYHGAVARLLRRVLEWLDPPPRRATRRFLRACRTDDPSAAARAWSEWTAVHPGFEPSDELRERLVEMQRECYGPRPTGGSGTVTRWSGAPLAGAFRRQRDERAPLPAGTALPPLNP